MIWARRILSTCEAAENAMRDLAGTAEQRLRLGISHVLTNPIVPMIFSTFLREHPKAQIYLNEGSMNKHVEMVTGEMLDLAYNAFPTAPEAEELEIIPMGTMEIHAVLHPDHPLARLDRIPLARLGEEKLIMMDAQSKVKELMSREFERHQVIPDILFNYDQVLCMANLVRSLPGTWASSAWPRASRPWAAKGWRSAPSRSRWCSTWGSFSKRALSAQAGVGADSLHPGEHPAGRHLTAGTPFPKHHGKKAGCPAGSQLFCDSCIAEICERYFPALPRQQDPDAPPHAQRRAFLFRGAAAVLVKLRACSMDRILKQPDHGRHGAVRPVGVMGEDGLHDGVMGVVDPQIDLPQLLRCVIPNRLHKHIRVEADNHVINQRGQRVVAGLGQSAVERHIYSWKLKRLSRVGLRALQGLPERLGILLRVVDGSQTGAAAVVDMPILQQLIQIDGPMATRFFRGSSTDFRETPRITAPPGCPRRFRSVPPAGASVALPAPQGGCAGTSPPAPAPAGAGPRTQFPEMIVG